MKTQTIEVDDRFGKEFRGTYELRQVTQGEYEQILVSYMNTLGKVSAGHPKKSTGNAMACTKKAARKSAADAGKGGFGSGSLWLKH